MMRSFISVMGTVSGTGRCRVPLYAFCMICMASALASSCVELELKTAGDDSGEAEISFTTDWDGVSEIEWPDSVFIAMNKVSDVLKYAFETDPSGAFFPDGDAVSVDSGTVDSGTVDSDTVDSGVGDSGTVDSGVGGSGTVDSGTVDSGTGDAGETGDGNGADDGKPRRYAAYGNYVVLAYACDKTGYELSGPENFLNDGALSVRDFRATVRELPAEELDALRDGSALDFNAAYRFIRMPGPLWTASLRTEVSDTRENVCRLPMQPMQMEVTVAVKIDTDSGIGIDSVVAELSGVPATFSLLTGELDESDLARVIFRMEASAAGVYEGTAAVPGLFPSGNVSLCTGPGILRLAVTAEKDGVKKVLRPAVNVGDLITSASLVERIAGSDGYRAAKRSARLEVGTGLRIGLESFTGGNGGDGVEKWFDSDAVDVEI